MVTTIDAVIVLIAFAGVALGCLSGLIGQIAWLLSMILGVILGGIASRVGGAFLSQWVPTWVGGAVSFILAFSLVAAAVRLAAHAARKTLKGLKIGRLDRIAGALVGMLTTVVLMGAVLLFGVLAESERVEEMIADSVIAPWLIDATARLSLFLPDEALAAVDRAVEAARKVGDGPGKMLPTVAGEDADHD